VGNLSRGHAGAQGAFGPIVGRLGTLGLIEEGQQTAPGVMPANLVEQALVVGVVQGPWLEMSINGLRDVLCFAGVVVYSPGMIALPQRDGIFEQGFERLPEGADRSGFVFEHLADSVGRSQRLNLPSPGFRPGFFGFAFFLPLEKGAACRLEERSLLFESALERSDSSASLMSGNDTPSDPPFQVVMLNSSYVRQDHIRIPLITNHA